jgi:lysozyme
MMTPRVVDISHYTTVVNLNKTAAAGIWGIICKASQGASTGDSSYDHNRILTKDAGMLWGAYHFGENHNPKVELENFLRHAKLDDNTLPCLDYEPYHAQMTIHQMVEFLQLGEQKIGRKFTIYSGNQLKEEINKLSAADHLYVCDHKLWLADYRIHFSLPRGFKSYFLWQYTGDGAGQRPHQIAGIREGRGLDLSAYSGTREELTAEWVAQAAPKPIVTPPQEANTVPQANVAPIPLEANTVPTTNAVPESWWKWWFAR